MKKYYSRKNIDSKHDKDSALIPPKFIYDEKAKAPYYNSSNRKWQSAPTIAKIPNGRLFCAYSGDNTEGDEGPNNYNTISFSDDDGISWINDYVVIDHLEPVRMHEPILWVSPQGELWHFWAQSFMWWDGRGGVWGSKCLNPEDDFPKWSKPIRLCHGVMATKPIVRANGEWMFPVSIWKNKTSKYNSFPKLEYSNVYVSRNKGETLEYIGSANEPDTTYDENNIIERRNGSLMMLMRTKDGISRSDSYDGGVTWSKPVGFVLPGPSARLYIDKLPSGAFVIVTHYRFTGRSHMTALLSYDEGETWKANLLLDRREKVSYPDGFIDNDGFVYAVYDRQRYLAREILVAKFKEEDIMAGQCVTEGSYLNRLVISSAG